jgi:hypothetical protein
MKDKIKLLLEQYSEEYLREEDNDETMSSEEEYTKEYKEKFGRDFKKDYQDVKDYFNSEGARATRASVFREVGFSEEDLYTGLPYKMLNQERNAEGGIYNFDEDTLNKIRTALPRG